MSVGEATRNDTRNEMALGTEFRALRRLVASMALCGLVLVSANFALDLWRRHDFETEGGEVRKLLDQITTRVEAQAFLMDENTRVARSLEDRLAKVGEEVEPAGGITPDVSEQTRASAPPPTSGGRSLEERSPGEILDAPLDELLLSVEAHTQDPFLAERYPKLLDPRTWNSAEIIADLEQAHQDSLGPEELEFAERTIAAYRRAAETAYSVYQIDLDVSLAERTLEEDFDRPLPSGEFAPPAVPQDQILAVALVGTKRYLWEKGRYPELHRKNVAYQYMPLAMLERLRRFFSERSAR